MTEPDPTGLIESHLPLVRQILFQVTEHYPRHVDRDELQLAGTLGLVEAAHHYDPEVGPFNRFASARIRGAILDSVRSWDWAPRSVRRSARMVDRADRILANRLGRSPTDAETAGELDLTASQLDRIRARVTRGIVLSLDVDLHDPDAAPGELVLADRLADDRPGPEEQIDRRELVAYLHAAVALLDDRHWTVVAGYFLEGERSDDLADLLGVTESRISQMRSEAIVILRDGIDAQYRDGPVIDLTDLPRNSALVRRGRYADAIAAATPWRDRLDLQEAH